MDRTREIYKVTLIGSAGNFLLLAFKFVAGFLGHSSAMIADAVHSLSDFFTDVIVLLFVKVSSKPQDESHDYGHGKFETVATLFIGLALIAAAVGIIVSGGRDFYRWYNGDNLEMPGKLALWAALISIVFKEILYRYTVAKGRKLNAPVVIANAWHHRSDALSSIGAAIGIGGAIILGQKWAVLDPIASIVVGLMLIRVAWKLMRGSIGDLTDQSLSPQEEQEITEIIHSIPEVSEPHNLRTRRIGNRVAIEVHIRMEGDISLNDAHSHATVIEDKLKERFGKDTLVTLHMEPTKH